MANIIQRNFPIMSLVSAEVDIPVCISCFKHFAHFTEVPLFAEEAHTVNWVYTNVHYFRRVHWSVKITFAQVTAT